ncbi:norbelladine synthase-like [Macadamia integrifolia]|uniref:norbelladine synthase-like n=1 Tax=Macadamia integrifolia TaxID=60698 RepID=UPI001C4F4B86|nr:norbelladine synthase-like [Macadamia integrifolia]
MHGKLFHEAVISAPANKVWDIYSTPKLGHLINQSLTSFLNVELLNGDGGEGSAVMIKFQSGAAPLVERVTKIDNENRIKVAELIEGCFLEIGFQLYRLSYEIIEKEANISIVKTTIEYEIEEQFISNVVFLTTKPFEAFATVVDLYLTEKSHVIFPEN